MSSALPLASRARHHAIVPAAGVGRRLGATVPKQYLEIAGRSVLRRTVETLAAASWIDSILIVVAPDDAQVAGMLDGIGRVRICGVGGPSRRDTVCNGLRELADAADHDWVLVHDAARPGLSLAALERLRAGLADDPVGGLLALPVADTVKRSAVVAAESRGLAQVIATIDRDQLWLAQTPQMFRKKLLLEALDRAPAATDEASAIEAMGLRPRLIEGERGNFKITTADDLALMRQLLGEKA